MKYVTPIVEIRVIEAKDVITASTIITNEVEDNNDGSGNVIFNTINLFY